jgi:hypothetical protein
MNTLTRSVIVAALVASSGAMLAHAQGAPAPDAGAEAAQTMRERVMPAQARGDRDHDRRGGPRGGRGAILGAFGPMGGQQMFAAVDADGDGAITQGEIDAFLAAQLSEADADADGALALEEFAPIFAERLRPRMVDAFQRLDADGSGEVTAAELDARFGAVVERLDRDGDDALTLQDGRRGRN